MGGGTTIHSPQAPQPRQPHYTARHQARLDTLTWARLEEFARSFHRKRSAILRYVMQWGLTQTQGWTVDRSAVVAVPPVAVLLERELLRHVQDAAAAHGTSIAAWLREAIRRVTADDFPASWRVGDAASRSHDSGYFDRKYQLRLDEASSAKLGWLAEHFDASAADVIRQLIAQAKPEDFPHSWQLAARERGSRRTRP
jgi:predicted transcriptional regulator